MHLDIVDYRNRGVRLWISHQPHPQLNLSAVVGGHEYIDLNVLHGPEKLGIMFSALSPLLVG